MCALTQRCDTAFLLLLKSGGGVRLWRVCSGDLSKEPHSNRINAANITGDGWCVCVNDVDGKGSGA